MDKQFLLIENNNFIDFPTGGTLSFDKHLLKVVPIGKIALVGSTTKKIKIGQWTTITIKNKEYDFFPIRRVSDVAKKPIIPSRISSVIALSLYLRKIRKRGHFNVFTQTPQFLFVLKYFKWESLCFCFAGVGNSVSISRYSLLQYWGSIYEKILFKTLKNNVDVILASADGKAINELKVRSNGLLMSKNIYPFPTRFDNCIFKPKNKIESRDKLGLPQNKTILVSIGRLCWIKGWDLLIDMMKIKKERNYLLIFVGDGEDRNKIEIAANEFIESGTIIISGVVNQIAVSDYINSSDVVLVGSYQEGWSTSMVESLACGKPIVSTNVSGASELIKDGENGFILYNRDPNSLINLIDDAVKLQNSSNVSIEISGRYSLDRLYSDLVNVWPAIK